MQKNLVIVESPAKAKTIEKFLGDDYKVLSSYGHIRDLKKKEFSIDTATFEPKYEIPAEKMRLVNELRTQAKKADTVWLASDEDREGEAISWHLYEVLGLRPETTKRIVFHEITKPAILSAIEHPRSIDLNLVNAQQARRVLDRIVGFKLSPVLWKKVKPALSAGRVQSVAVRLIVEREREVQAYKSEESYRVTAVFRPEGGDKSTEIRAELNQRFKTRDEAAAFLESCAHADFRIDDVTTRPQRRTPAAPFTTSTLQQEAAHKLGFTVAQTMMVAQRLYESGQITYMRTDSVNLSALCIKASTGVITEMMGEQYVKSRRYQTKSKGAQEAHEAIRPTYMDRTEIEATPQERRLYDLIWKRTIASQMADAELEKTTVSIGISGQTAQFIATGEVIKFDGFLKVYRETRDEELESSEDESRLLPPLTAGQVLERTELVATEQFSRRPPRYNEASLVRKLEELGIGRPSTYAPTISTIQQREYVVKGDKPGEQRDYTVLTLKDDHIEAQQHTMTIGAERGKLLPTDIGTVVNDFLLSYFPGIMDYNFTAEVEKEFDDVAEGNTPWTQVIKNFYDGFAPRVEQTPNVKSEHKVGERHLGDDPKSGRPVFVKIGRFGPEVQIGSAEDSEKPRFAQLRKDQSIETLTLEEALELFRLPRILGTYEDNEVSVGAGRFGPYVRYAAQYVSIPSGKNPLEITLEEAIELIRAKQQAETQRHLKKFDEEPELEVISGRYGPYIAYKGQNYRLPKALQERATELTLAECKAQIEAQADKPKATKAKRTTARKK